MTELSVNWFSFADLLPTEINDSKSAAFSGISHVLRLSGVIDFQWIMLVDETPNPPPLPPITPVSALRGEGVGGKAIGQKLKNEGSCQEVKKQEKGKGQVVN